MSFLSALGTMPIMTSVDFCIGRDSQSECLKPSAKELAALRQVGLRLQLLPIGKIIRAKAAARDGASAALAAGREAQRLATKSEDCVQVAIAIATAQKKDAEANAAMDARRMKRGIAQRAAKNAAAQAAMADAMAQRARQQARSAFNNAATVMKDWMASQTVTSFPSKPGQLCARQATFQVVGATDLPLVAPSVCVRVKWDQPNFPTPVELARTGVVHGSASPAFGQDAPKITVDLPNNTDSSALRFEVCDDSVTSSSHENYEQARVIARAALHGAALAQAISGGRRGQPAKLLLELSLPLSSAAGLPPPPPPTLLVQFSMQVSEVACACQGLPQVATVTVMANCFALRLIVWIDGGNASAYAADHAYGAVRSAYTGEGVLGLSTGTKLICMQVIQCCFCVSVALVFFRFFDNLSIFP